MSRWIEAFALKGQQAQAVAARGQDVSLTAGAGSGKTRTLTARYVSLLDEGYAPRGLAAVTFTEKAAREMRNRIRSAIYTWRTGDCPADERPRWEAIEADIDTARIGTIHALCAALLRAHPAEAEIDPRFEVLDEGQAATLLAQAVDDALGWAVHQSDLLPLFQAFEARDLVAVLGDLLAAPFEASAAFSVPELAARWNENLRAAIRAWVEADEVQAAITDLRELDHGQRLSDDAGDKLTGQVQGALAHWETLTVLVERGQPLLAAQVLFELRRGSLAGATGKKDSVAKAAVKVLRDTYDEVVNPWLGGKGKGDLPPDPTLESQAAFVSPLLKRVFERAQQHYESAKDQRHALDFDDLEGKALALLERAEIRARWQKQIAALMVDEFQDTNARQRRIVEALAGIGDGQVGRLFVVGDAKQSIYRFRGADVTVFRAMSRAIAARAGLALALDHTFRAHPGLVSAVNDLMQAIMGMAESEREPYRVPFAPLQAERAQSSAKLPAPHIEFLCGIGSNAGLARPVSAQVLAQRLRQLHEQQAVPWDQMALLFRASTTFPVYEAALEAAGIPFVTIAGRGFYHRPEIRDLLNMLAVLVDPWDDAALAGALRSPAFGLSDATLYHLRWPAAQGVTEPERLRVALQGNLAALSETERELAVRANAVLTRLQAQAERVSVADLLKSLLDETHYFAILSSHPHGPRLRRNVEKLLADAHTSGMTRVTEFLEYIETLRDVGAREGEAPSDAGGAVRLMTVHKAKGLEFPVVVMADAAHASRAPSNTLLLSPTLGVVLAPTRAEQKPLMMRLARQTEAAQTEAENARLLYVAATRAKEKLIISGHLGHGAGHTWLGQLANAARLDLDDLITTPGAWQTVTLPGGETVGGLAQSEADPPPDVRAAATSIPELDAPSLYLPPVIGRISAERIEPEAVPPHRLPRVLGRLRHPDGMVVGKLVHEAIRRWRFPGDNGFERGQEVMAHSLGLVDSFQARPHLERAAELLTRLRIDSRWPGMHVAEQAGQAWHEVPYSLPGSRGVIDLLYRDVNRQWRVVDFKTDALEAEAALQQALERQYRAQALRYQSAVRELIGQPVMAELCLLDYCQGIHWLILG